MYSTGIESLFITRKAGYFRLAVMGKPKLVYNKSILGRSRLFLSEVGRQHRIRRAQKKKWFHPTGEIVRFLVS